MKKMSFIFILALLASCTKKKEQTPKFYFANGGADSVYFTLYRNEYDYNAFINPLITVGVPSGQKAELPDFINRSEMYFVFWHNTSYLSNNWLIASHTWIPSDANVYMRPIIDYNPSYRILFGINGVNSTWKSINFPSVHGVKLNFYKSFLVTVLYDNEPLGTSFDFTPTYQLGQTEYYLYFNNGKNYIRYDYPGYFPCDTLLYIDSTTTLSNPYKMVRQ